MGLFLRKNHRDWWVSHSSLIARKTSNEFLTETSRLRKNRRRQSARYRECRRSATSTWCCAPRAGAWGSSLRSSIYRGSIGRKSASRRWPCRSPSWDVSAGLMPTSTSGRSGDTHAAVASQLERGAHLKREASIRVRSRRPREDRVSSPLTGWCEPVKSHLESRVERSRDNKRWTQPR